jgi:hypothetical protein
MTEESPVDLGSGIPEGKATSVVTTNYVFQLKIHWAEGQLYFVSVRKYNFL